MTLISAGIVPVRISSFEISSVRISSVGISIPELILLTGILGQVHIVYIILCKHLFLCQIHGLQTDG